MGWLGWDFGVFAWDWMLSWSGGLEKRALKLYSDPSSSEKAEYWVFCCEAVDFEDCEGWVNGGWAGGRALECDVVEAGDGESRRDRLEETREAVGCSWVLAADVDVEYLAI